MSEADDIRRLTCSTHLVPKRMDEADDKDGDDKGCHKLVQDYEYWQIEEIPIGYRFKPTDQELILSYLINKVTFSPLPPNIIRDIDEDDLYGKHPKEIVKNSLNEREWYFFMKPNGSNFFHTTREIRSGKGFWKMEDPRLQICYESGSRIGSKTNMSFFERTPRRPSPKKTLWRMVEFQLQPDCIRAENVEWKMAKLMKGKLA